MFETRYLRTAGSESAASIRGSERAIGGRTAQNEALRAPCSRASCAEWPARSVLFMSDRAGLAGSRVGPATLSPSLFRLRTYI